eukprot:CAMPEP_0172778406 /NCGR_PEP_ID=MMETSP1074-20121228/201891_1 /TAXON_ID=2916 /ORGANISM="Ceratium fusus, Strain PA161109" /LENGTH=163 /DNA_ID=CAMNT_0013615339 /DNA_START=70 /DNA_END=561 /DNA_ORIENTATION=-
MAWFMERRLRNVELDLEQIEDVDVVTRWGQVSRLSGYTAVQGLSKEGGLAPSQILGLPSAEMPDHPGAVQEECPICLNVMKCGDMIRQLLGAGEPPLRLHCRAGIVKGGRPCAITNFGIAINRNARSPRGGARGVSHMPECVEVWRHDQAVEPVWTYIPPLMY